eukprot:9502106-Pyramimonas_sp.AAC.1
MEPKDIQHMSHIGMKLLLNVATKQHQTDAILIKAHLAPPGTNNVVATRARAHAWRNRVEKIRSTTTAQQIDAEMAKSGRICTAAFAVPDGAEREAEDHGQQAGHRAHPAREGQRHTRRRAVQAPEQPQPKERRRPQCDSRITQSDGSDLQARQETDDVHGEDLPHEADAARVRDHGIDLYASNGAKHGCAQWDSCIPTVQGMESPPTASQSVPTPS